MRPHMSKYLPLILLLAACGATKPTQPQDPIGPPGPQARSLTGAIPDDPDDDGVPRVAKLHHEMLRSSSKALARRALTTQTRGMKVAVLGAAGATHDPKAGDRRDRRQRLAEESEAPDPHQVSGRTQLARRVTLELQSTCIDISKGLQQLADKAREQAATPPPPGCAG